ncbi:MAG TPA: type 1 glutamine amidotransferase-like domain-containing protein [Clostridiaceae bacterium]|nr:type 1 glutamine amidotransferase-like domain-containing protein [Clostridiaceae bacterium]
MNNILLLSSGLAYLKQFVGREAKSVEMVFVPTAGNPDKDVWWIDKDRDVLSKMGFSFKELDIANKKAQELQGALDGVDVVYIAGGYTYYLLEQMRISGFDKMLQEFIEQGGMYAGASAGALVAGPDIEPCAAMDDPKYGPGLKSSAGLNLVKIVPMPHYDMSERKGIIDSIVDKYESQYVVVPMTDDEAIISDGKNWAKVESKRSDVEYNWFNKVK